ncbi:MAG TPA: hypothetical protein VGH70_17890 [Bradyrhizobium sp.]
MPKISAKATALRNRRLMAALFAVPMIGSVSLDPAHAEYPDHPITIIACFPPGGGNDVAMRLINTQLGEALGKPVIIENRGGAGGNIGTSVKRQLRWPIGDNWGGRFGGRL